MDNNLIIFLYVVIFAIYFALNNVVNWGIRRLFRPYLKTKGTIYHNKEEIITPIVLTCIILIVSYSLFHILYYTLILLGVYGAVPKIPTQLPTYLIQTIIVILSILHIGITQLYNYCMRGLWGDATGEVDMELLYTLVLSALYGWGSYLAFKYIIGLGLFLITK